MNKFNISNKYNIADNLYIVSNKSTTTTSTVASFSLDNFKFFATGISRVHSFQLTSSSFYTSAVDTLVLYAFIYCSHQSSFVRHCANYSKILTVPSFIYLFLVKIVTEVRSTNKEVALSNGVLHVQSDWTSIHDALSELLTNDEFLRSTLSDTPFERVLTSKKTIKEFRQILEIRLSLYNSYSNDYDLFNHMISFFSNLQHVFYAPSSLKIQSFEVKEISGALGIYRFRNYDEHIFLCQQHSMISLNGSTRDMYFCFLRIFEPIFLTEGCHSTIQIPGDGMYIVTELDLCEAWERYVAFSATKPGKRSFRPENNPGADNAGGGQSKTGEGNSPSTTTSLASNKSSASASNYRIGGERLEIYSDHPNLQDTGTVMEILLPPGFNGNKYRSTIAVELTSSGLQVFSNQIYAV